MGTLNIPDNIQPSELVDALERHWGLADDGDLARALGVGSRTNVAQFRRRTGVRDIQYRIIVGLLQDIAYLEGKLESGRFNAVAR